MHIPASTLDIFDDGGALLKAHFPRLEDLPEVIKTAEVTDRSEHHPSEFALVLSDGEVQVPRYLLSSPGHTALSVLYFGETHPQLSEEAQKVAAARLGAACEHHGLPVPGLLRSMAGDLLLRAPAPLVFVGSREEVKIAEAPADRGDLSYALDDRYPLGSPAEIKAALHYFDEHQDRFTPEDRHRFAYNVVAAAEDAGLRVPPEIEKQAGVDWNPGLGSHLMVRRHILRERGAPLEHSVTLEKLAGYVGHIPAVEFAEALAHFDRRTGLDESWDSEIFDPYASTLTKLAAPAEVKKAWTIDEVGQVTEDDLSRAAASSRTLRSIASTLGDDLATRFSANPMATFSKVQGRLRVVLARIITDRRDEP